MDGIEPPFTQPDPPLLFSSSELSTATVEAPTSQISTPGRTKEEVLEKNQRKRALFYIRMHFFFDQHCELTTCKQGWERFYENLGDVVEDFEDDELLCISMRRRFLFEQWLCDKIPMDEREEEIDFLEEEYRNWLDSPNIQLTTETMCTHKLNNQEFSFVW